MYVQTFGMCFVSIVGLLICCIMVRNTWALESNFLRNYDALICNNKRSCHLVDHPNLPKSRYTLEGRDCMCDFECPEYDDCCDDSEFYRSPTTSGRKYYCSPMGQVYVITTCPPDYTNYDVKSKCEASINPGNGDDSSIIQPVTNLRRRLTYGNIFCAQCNGDLFDFVLWNVSAKCEEIRRNDVDVFLLNDPINYETFNRYVAYKRAINFVPMVPTKSSPFRRIDYQSRKKRDDDYFNNRLLENARYDSEAKKFIGRYNDEEFICEISSQLSQEMDLFVRKCVPDLVSSCPPHADVEIVEQCRIRTAIVYEKSARKAFRNRECAKCNGVSELSLTGCPV